MGPFGASTGGSQGLLELEAQTVLLLSDYVRLESGAVG